MKRAFTIIELLVVIAIILILAGVTLPLISSMTRNNAQKQAVNQVGATLQSARALALNTRRQVAVVFYEETAANSNPVNSNQTAVCVAIEAVDQTGAASGNTIFEPATARGIDYMPTGVRVATLDDRASYQYRLNDMNPADPADASVRVRAVVFDGAGQMVLRNGLASPALVGTPSPGIGRFFLDWNFVLPNGDPTLSASSPGVIVFDGRKFDEMKAAFFDANPSADATAQSTQWRNWLTKNADVLIVNAYTGGLIR